MANLNLLNSNRGAECLLSSSSSSTSSSSSANQHNQQLLDFNNNLKQATESIQFNSRSLGTFQAASGSYDSNKPAPSSSLKKNSQQASADVKNLNGSETNLSVKTAVRFALFNKNKPAISTNLLNQFNAHF
jgi:hypothetical protein